MKNCTRLSFGLLLLGSLLLALSSCKKEEPEIKVINHFSMRTNSEEWIPFQSLENPCESTFHGSYALYGENPFFNIYAYRDPNGISNADSENVLIMQLMDVKEPTSINLDGSYKHYVDYDSYILFRTQSATGENVKRYVNDHTRSPFVVHIEDVFIPKGSTSIPGIIGSFGGVIYNEADPTDSLIITNGKFNLSYMGGYNCGF